MMRRAPPTIIGLFIAFGLPFVFTLYLGLVRQQLADPTEPLRQLPFAPLGNALEAFQHVPDLSYTYICSFERGLVLVNTDLEPRQIALPERVYINAWRDNRHQRTILLPGHSARILVNGHPYPRIMAHMDRHTMVEEFTKYYAVSVPGRYADRAQALRRLRPDMIILRYFPARAHQNDEDNIPLRDTFPGHWLFYPATTLSTAVNAITTTLHVQGFPRRGHFEPGFYAMIWDGNAITRTLTPQDPAFWANAEHVYITGVDRATQTITVTRGYQSAAIPHPAGSHIAVHVPGAGTDYDIWSYNQSTFCPPDWQGRRFNQVMADWLAQNLNVINGVDYGTLFNGILFDTTLYWLPEGPDVDNDDHADGGLVEPGRNAWGEGMSEMFRRLRQNLGPDYIITGGVPDTRGFEYLNGNQMEGFPVVGGQENPDGDTSQYDALLSTYFIWNEVAGYPPHYSEILNKQPTEIHHSGSVYGPNSLFRFSFGSALLSDGYYGQKVEGKAGDFWWDEYAVDLTTGQAVPPTASAAEKTAHTGYLGYPLGGPQRLISFDPAQNRMGNGDFEVNLDGWSLNVSGGGAATMARDSRTAAVESASLYVNVLSATTSVENIQVESPLVAIQAGQEYTLRFWAKAEDWREIGVQVGDYSTSLLLTKEWRPYTLDFTVTLTVQRPVYFLLSREWPDVWLDGVEFYVGGADLFRRDFEHGIVLVNGTGVTQTVALGEVFRKIGGTQDPRVNDGATVTQVMLPPRDALILLRSHRLYLPMVVAN